MVDTGIGTKFDEKLRNIYTIDYSKFSLVKSLSKHGINPEDVTDVVLTHLHFDHVGGAVYREGESNLQFPNAIHYIQKRQLEWARKKFPKDRASYLSENIEPLLQLGKTKLLSGSQNIFDDIDIMLTHGHTPAQQLLLISGKNEKIIFAGDTIPMKAHIQIPWIMAYDLNPVKTVKEKNKILSKAVIEDWIIFFEHDPLVCCSTIEKGEKGFQLKEVIVI